MWQWTLTPGSSGSSSLSSSFPSHSLPPFQSKLPTQLTQVVPALLGAATSIRDWLQGRAISISSSSSLGKKITRLLTQKTTAQRLWALPPVLWNALIEGARSLFATLWELEEEQVTVRCAPWAFLHFRWLRSGFAALLAISSYYSTKFKMFLPKITYKGHCCTPAPAGCTLSGSYPRIWCHLISQRVPSLRHWSHSLLLTLVNPVCSTGPRPNKGTHLYTCKQHCMCYYFRSPFTALVGVGSGLGKWIRSIPCPYMDRESVWQSIHLVPANHLLHDWSLSSVNPAGSPCFLSQCAPSIYWPFVTTLADHHSFHLNEQHSNDIKCEVHQMQQKVLFI